MSAIDREPQDIDARLRAETDKLLAEMEEQIRRARARLAQQPVTIAVRREEGQKLRENVDRIDKIEKNK